MSFKSTIVKLAAVSLMPMAYTDKTTGEQAYVKRMTIAEREAYSNKIMSLPKNGKVNATCFSLIACDKDGNLLFTEDEIDTVNKLPENIVLDALAKFNEAIQPTSIEQAEKN